MEVLDTIHIVAAEKLNHGLVIQFDDGKCAFYSTTLLHATFPQAEELDETETVW